ncbi:hydrophobin-domain-containing protein [Armillaria solidipes]|uniref:Hydrophobin n=1 Tax=Armillaria solidipes TaxID=1076256 RepID=A0A2H3AKJ9_9AGAR|nr:hydrophobin-domain-containing protein [Armillaria solidipes]
MFLRHSFTALLALPLLANAGVIPIISPVPPRDGSTTGIAGRQVVTVAPTICPVLRRDESDDGTDIAGRQVAPTICAPALPRDEADEHIAIAGRQVTTISPVVGPVLPIGSSIVSSRQITGLPIISSVLPDLPHDESNDGAVITGRQVVTVSPVLSAVAAVARDDGAALTGRQVITGSPVISPVLPRGGGDGAACSATGTAQCCGSTESASDVSSGVATLLGLLGVVVSDLTANVGVTCSPISVIGVGGTSCSSQAVCCDNNHYNGLVALGCTPLNVGL